MEPGIIACQLSMTSMPLCLQICDGATSAERTAWQLKPAKEFKLLNQSNCYTLPRVDNAEEYMVRGCQCQAAVMHACWCQRQWQNAL